MVVTKTAAFPKSGGPLRRLIPIVTGGLIAAWVGCASPGAPPGGPVDTAAPVLIGVAPESGAVRSAPRAVVFRFDEVVSERPTSVASLASLFLISPQEGTPVVDWNRSEITVRPRRGWRANTAYTVTMLPGMMDLRGNASREQRVIVFSTGAEIPQTRVSGRVFDWTAGAPGVNALVQAMGADSIVYTTVADSAGSFTLLHLPPGQYVVQAILDDNRNWARDPRERFDSLVVALRDTFSADFLAFVRDSIPPRISNVEARDSVTVRVTFDLPLDPTERYNPGQFSIGGAGTDSVLVRAAVPVEPDTTRTRMPRPIPARAVRLIVTPMRLGTTYTVRTTGVRGLTGVGGPSERTLRTPAEFRPDTTAREETTP